MYYKLKEWQVDKLISFIAYSNLNQDSIIYSDTFNNIRTLVFDIVKEGGYRLVPMESVKKIINISNIQSPLSELLDMRQEIINMVWDCELVEYRPKKGVWKIPIYGRKDEFSYLAPNQYYEVLDLKEADKKIKAVKVLREATYLGLVEAKNMYEKTFDLAEKVDEKG